MRHSSGLQSRRKGSQGFTLLELVIVIVILAILAGVAVPRYIRTVARSRSVSALTMLSSLRESAQRYYAKQNPPSYVGMTLANIDFDPTDVSGLQCFTYGNPGGLTAVAFTFTATGLAACGLAVADTITVDQAGTVAGAGVFAGI